MPKGRERRDARRGRAGEKPKSIDIYWMNISRAEGYKTCRQYRTAHYLTACGARLATTLSLCHALLPRLPALAFSIERYNAACCRLLKDGVGQNGVNMAVKRGVAPRPRCLGRRTGGVARRRLLRTCDIPVRAAAKTGATPTAQRAARRTRASSRGEITYRLPSLSPRAARSRASLRKRGWDGDRHGRRHTLSRMIYVSLQATGAPGTT